MNKSDGVSPVIGTILLVAITVVIVAILSAVVIGMAGGIGNAHVVGVKVFQGTDVDAINKTIIVTITGGDTAGLQGIAVVNGTSLVNGRGYIFEGVPMRFDGTITDPIEDADNTRLGAGLTYISVLGMYPDGLHDLYMGTITLV